LYSGAVGYFTPDNDFDFNVVIRSILYNEENDTFRFRSAVQLLLNRFPKRIRGMFAQSQGDVGSAAIIPRKCLLLGMLEN